MTVTDVHAGGDGATRETTIVSAAREAGLALQASHRRLFEAVENMSPGQIAGPSYCADWSVAQVLSHIGSGAEIFALILDAGLSGAELPGGEVFAPIWDAWNALPPEQKASASRTADAAFLERLAAVPDDELDRLRMTVFGIPADATTLLTMRLSEHTLHTWDVLVMDDPAAVLAAGAVDWILDGLGRTVDRAGKPDGRSFSAEIVTTDPGRTLQLAVSDNVAMTPARPETARIGTATARVHLPAEALIRLVYGRLDPAHTPPTTHTDGIELNELRAIFPGV